MLCTQYALNFIEFYAEEAKRCYGDIIPSPMPGKRMLTIKQVNLSVMWGRRPPQLSTFNHLPPPFMLDCSLKSLCYAVLCCVASSTARFILQLINTIPPHTYALSLSLSFAIFRSPSLSSSP